MHTIIIHGMGRTPLSMWLLAYRFSKIGIKTSLFAYSATFEGLDGCTQRLRNFIARKVGDGDFIVVTHSLGSVLIRAVLPAMYRKPNACFLLAPPTQACDAARRLAFQYWYRMLAGEMGQLFANQKFMSRLQLPKMPTKIYAGNAGLTGRFHLLETSLMTAC
jgi:alpha-beta hydrolase superfamily lysophospholipase